MPEPTSTTLGSFLASRLSQIGVKNVFAVPGDFNLVLLDQLVAHKDLNMVWNCNELNAGYAADGYCRQAGVAACCVTFGVGGFSALNAVAGAYSEDLPVIFISGGPNSNDFATDHVIHHTTGVAGRLDQQHAAFAQVTCAAEVVQHVTRAAAQIDSAISAALRCRKPAYIEICCNLAGLTHPSFPQPPIPFQLPTPHTNQASLEAAVAATVKLLEGAVKPVLLGGPRLRQPARRAAFLRLADATGYAVAVTPDGKGLFPEDHPSFIGHYWGSISSDACGEAVEAADLVLVAGAVWTDYSTLGYSHLLPADKTVEMGVDGVTLRGGAHFGCIGMEHYLEALAAAAPPNQATLTNWRRMVSPPPALQLEGGEEVLTRRQLFGHLQGRLTSSTIVLAETGDSWFNALDLKLPPGAGFELQLRYGSIGWSVGATLGYALGAAGAGRRVVALIGDGSFQMTAQEVSTMLRFGANPIILLINNAGYTIEVEIHDGPYNRVQVWDYVGFVKSLHNGRGKLYARKVATCGELVEALDEAWSSQYSDHLVFLEVVLDRDDCSKQLLEFGARVAAANSRLPNPQ